MLRRFVVSSATWSLVLVVAGCSSGPTVTYGGTKVAEPDKVLETVESQWKAAVGRGKVKANVPDEARCYFQVATVEDAKALWEKVLCGPYRLMASTETTWDAAKIVPVGSDGEAVRLGLGGTGGDTFTPGTAAEGLSPWRPDGKVADLQVKVNEPDAPKVGAGTVIDSVSSASLGTPSLGAPSDGPEAESQPVIMPDGRYTVHVTRQARVGDPENRKAAPEGGTFLVFKLARDSISSAWALSPDGRGTPTISTTAAVKVGGKSYPVPLDTSTSDHRALAVAGDGKDAVFEFTYDGLAQSIGLDGKRIGNPAPAMYLARSQGASDALSAQIGGSEQDGWRAIGRLTDIKVQLTAYDREKKWAPAGQAWAVVTASLSEDVPTFYKGWSSASYDTKLNVTDFTLDGQKAVSETIGDSTWSGKGLRYVFAVPIAPDKTALQLKVLAQSVGPKKEYGEASAPANASIKYEFNGTVNLTE
ncbi:hypothetical protein [Arsenicicoccus dermatophilus]|uniref:hypothetical protein n=1 Tax=Arsenicicoccus dermatophilus TaxID=1076331 RepID=UPI003917068B